MKNYNEMDMRQTSQVEVDEQEIDGMNLYCLIGMLCSILGALMMLFLSLGLGLCVGVIGITLSAIGLYMHNKTRKNLSGKVFGKVGIIVPIVGIVLYIVIFAVTYFSIGRTVDYTNQHNSTTVEDISDEPMFNNSNNYDPIFD